MLFTFVAFSPTFRDIHGYKWKNIMVNLKVVWMFLTFRQFVPNKYTPPQTPPPIQIQQRQHTYKPHMSANTVPSKSFQKLERKYSVDSDAGSDSLKNTHVNEDITKSIFKK